MCPRARRLEFGVNVQPPLCVTHHMSCVMSHMSHMTYHISCDICRFFLLLFFKLVKLACGGSVINGAYSSSYISEHKVKYSERDLYRRKAYLIELCKRCWRLERCWVKKTPLCWQSLLWKQCTLPNLCAESCDDYRLSVNWDNWGLSIQLQPHLCSG